MVKGQKFTKWKDKFNKNEVLNLINKGNNVKKIANIIGIPHRRVGEMIRYYNLPIKSFRQTINKNNDFFEQIDSELKAYLLGYTLADGCVLIEPKKRNGKIYAHSKRISFCVSIDDREVIELLKESIAPGSYIKESHNTKGAVNRKKQLSLRFSSTKLVDDLMNLNIKPRKTMDINFKFDFNKLPDDLVRHFIRGFFDGDGWISTESRIVGMVATSKEFLKQIQDEITKYVKTVEPMIVSQKSKNMIYYQLLLPSCSKKNRKGPRKELMKKKADSIIDMYNYLYDDSNYCLSRKKIKFNIDNTVLT